MNDDSRKKNQTNIMCSFPWSGVFAESFHSASFFSIEFSIICCEFSLYTLCGILAFSSFYLRRTIYWYQGHNQYAFSLIVGQVRTSITIPLKQYGNYELNRLIVAIYTFLALPSSGKHNKAHYWWHQYINLEGLCIMFVYIFICSLISTSDCRVERCL